MKTMQIGNGREILEGLLSREPILQVLADGPHSKPELVETSDLSRSTIDRAISSLESVGLVTRSDRGQYELTSFGIVSFQMFKRICNRMDHLTSAQQFINEIGNLDDIDVSIFEGARIRSAEGYDISSVIKTFSDASAIRVIDPPIYLLFLWFVSGTGPTVDGDIEVYLRNDLLSEIKSSSPSLAETYHERGIGLFEIEASPPFSFALVDGSSYGSFCLILGNQKEGLAVIENRTTEAFEWGQSLFEEYTENARLVSAESNTN